MKTILHIITLSETGGAQKIVYNLINGFKDDYRLLLACAQGGELVGWVESLGVEVFEIPYFKRNISPLNDLMVLISLVKIIRYEKVDIVHCHSWKGGVFGRLAAFFAGAEKIFFTVHGWSKLHSPVKLVKSIYWLVEKLLSFITSKIVCVCDTDREMGTRLNIAPADKFVTIYNGIGHVDSERSIDVRGELGIERDGIVIGTIARLAEPKMVVETILLIKGLFKKYKKLYYVWVGDGPLYEIVEQRLFVDGVYDRFVLVGNQEDVYKYLRAMDIFLLLSKYEGLPVSILEAMNVGLPVIASNAGGIKEQVKDNVNGFLVGGDLDMIENKIEMMINDKKLRDKYGMASRKIFDDIFTVDKMIEQYRDLYEEKL